MYRIEQYGTKSLAQRVFAQLKSFFKVRKHYVAIGFCPSLKKKVEQFDQYGKQFPDKGGF